jgi:hypothetical protein
MPAYRRATGGDEPHDGTPAAVADAREVILAGMTHLVDAKGQVVIAEAATLWTGDPELLVPFSPWTWHDLR